MKKIAIVLGTRPEIIKMAPVIRQCETENIDHFVIHTGQHYSAEMDEYMYKDLDLSLPRYRLEVGSGAHGEQTAKMLTAIEQILLTEKPTMTLVQGDTNSVLAGALTSAKLHIPVGHIEAGLRSYDKTMPEEINRIITDHISDYLFVPTEAAKECLVKEGIPLSKVYVTGNTIVDSVLQSLEIAEEKSTMLHKLELKSKKFFLLTIHRAENTDCEKTLHQLVDTIKHITTEHSDMSIILPLHPRTKSRLESYSLYDTLTAIPRLQIINPVGFLDFLVLEQHARLVITDSGGVQEETCILGTPSITLRENTERPETVTVGANIIVGTDKERILAGIKTMLLRNTNWKNPFGDGTTSQKILNTIR